MFRAWIDTLTAGKRARRSRSVGKRGPRFRPVLTGLEERLVPADFPVTSLADSREAAPGTLRRAIMDANRTAGSHTITFDPSLAGLLDLNTPLEALNRNITITGPGPDADGRIPVTVRRSGIAGTANFRIFTVNAGQSVTISALKISNGAALSADNLEKGGGISNAGNLTLIDCEVSGNKANGGGGIANGRAGVLILANTKVLGNTATTGDGGGIFNAFGQVQIRARSEIADNTAQEDGGGIFNVLSGKVIASEATFKNNKAQTKNGGAIYNGRNGVPGVETRISLTKCTFSGNTALQGNGGAIYNDGTQRLRTVTGAKNKAKEGGGIHETSRSKNDKSGVTVTGNEARRVPSPAAEGGLGLEFGGQGGGVFIEPGAEDRTVNSIIAGNSADFAPDVAGPLGSLGHNLIGNSTGGYGFSFDDLVGSGNLPLDPQLLPLGDYGGPSETCLPGPASPAIGGGDIRFVAFGSTDQRGYDRVVDGRVDIGAVEVQPSDVQFWYWYPPTSEPNL